jgi:hypothetical protein
MLVTDLIPFGHLVFDSFLQSRPDRLSINLEKLESPFFVFSLVEISRIQVKEPDKAHPKESCPHCEAMQDAQR